MDENNRFDILPDGSMFEFWDIDTEFEKTFHVAQGSPAASDENPGTPELPFRTVSKAAGILRPGERVIIHEGVYREFVRPKRGGTDKSNMISYEAAPGERVVISGAEVWNAEWKKSEGWRPEKTNRDHLDVTHKQNIWTGELPGGVFAGINPFSMVNVSSQPWIGGDYFFQYMPKESKFHEYMQRRGILFVDGMPLEQVTYYYQLGERTGTYWVEDSGMIIHFRLPHDDDPKDHRLEFTAREQAFAPCERCTSFIRVKGIIFECVGNGFPGTQHGALSVYCGHHWIIEDNVVRMVNSIGIDIGHESPYRALKEQAGYHIVRRNKITDCGICGICGVPNDEGFKSVLIEKNRFERNGWHNVEFLYELGSIKIHLAHGCIIRHNIISETLHGPGIWIDYWNINSRICGNVILNCRSAMFGAIFVEASHYANMVDNNVIWGAEPDEETQKGGNGIYEHDCDRITVRNNFFGNIKGAGVQFYFGCPGRIVNGRGATGRKHRIENNVFVNCGLAVALPTMDNFSNGNIYGKLNKDAPFRVEKPEEMLNFEAWQEFMGWDKDGRQAEIKAELDGPALKLKLAIKGEKGVVETTIDLSGEFDIGAKLHGEQ